MARIIKRPKSEVPDGSKALRAAFAAVKGNRQGLNVHGGKVGQPLDAEEAWNRLVTSPGQAGRA